ncbi:MAG: phosphopantothenoylcysteine decarboxylase [Pirellulales bacterium]|nr:phosphopantothenoylcysteine decarboxylase [Pirellulales bacterium]
MIRLLVTSGPTREYLDPVRFLSNASSGRMGQALAQAALEAGWEVVVVSGPVTVDYPPSAQVVPVVSTQEMLEACLHALPQCHGVIAAAAPCDYRPRQVAAEKISKTGQPLRLELEETPDILTSLAAHRTHQWLVGFALETSDRRQRALAKLTRKGCDLIVVNGPEAMHGTHTSVEVLDRRGMVLLSLSADKLTVARKLIGLLPHAAAAAPHPGPSEKERGSLRADGAD